MSLRAFFDTVIRCGAEKRGFPFAEAKYVEFGCVEVRKSHDIQNATAEYIFPERTHECIFPEPIWR